MFLINTSAKVINIGAEVVLPNKSIPVKDDVIELPSIKTLIGMGLLMAVKGNPETVVKPQENPDAAPDEKPELTAAAKAAEGLGEMSKDELKSLCESLGIEFKANESKAELIKKIEAKNANAE